MQRTWPKLVLLSDCWLFYPWKCVFLRKWSLVDWGSSADVCKHSCVWDISPPLAAPFPTLFFLIPAFFIFLLLLRSSSCPLSVTALWCFHFPPLVYNSAFLSAPITARQYSFFGSYKVLRRKWGVVFMFTIRNTETNAVPLPLLFTISLQIGKTGSHPDR